MLAKPEADFVLLHCSNCRVRPIASEVKCGYKDWCFECDDSLFESQYDSGADESLFWEQNHGYHGLLLQEPPDTDDERLPDNDKDLTE